MSSEDEIRSILRLALRKLDQYETEKRTDERSTIVSYIRAYALQARYDPKSLFGAEIAAAMERLADNIDEKAHDKRDMEYP